MLKNTSQTFHSKKSASLNPEYDEVQAAIEAELMADDLQDLLAELAEDPDVSLVCDHCNQVFVFDIKFAEDICTECNMGILEIVDGDGVVIELPKAVKEGGHNYKNYGQQSMANAYSGNGHSSNSWQMDRCDHTGDKIVFEWNGKKLYAANNTGLKEWSGKWDLIIDLAGIVQLSSPSTFISSSAPGRFRPLKEFIDTNVKKLPSEYLRLNWTDMGVPPVTLDFWIHLWDMLPEKTVICCFGGHGRTGTCLGSLMIAAGIDYYSAVETIHKDHCSKAIETPGQEAYLHKLYVEYLNRKLKTAEQAGNQAEIVDVKEDIEFAAKNPPGWGSKSSGHSFQPDNNSGGPTVYYAVGAKNNASDSSELGKALASGLPVKTVGTTVYVKECCKTGCYKSTCDNQQHVDWVLWSQSLAKVDIEVQNWNEQHVS